MEGVGDARAVGQNSRARGRLRVGRPMGLEAMSGMNTSIYVNVEGTISLIEKLYNSHT